MKTKRSLASSLRSWAGYKSHGTQWASGEVIDHMLDPVHFTHSHHSRMLQLADLFIYMKQFVAAGDYGKPTRKEIIERAASISNCLAPVKYKTWPNQ
ncbi:DUF3800 domain-containing protein [Cupriavidus sp. Marseille-Q8015]